ncbi:transcription antitermination factor NusB [Lacticigenium naphthae]|uniref:transcription antitermination factor NusB n=1 Tax=Lacticigenium naphthae TaxID=515351 RepID=UPI0004861FD1|nr:transcription antitermination factor NusB [Lacticigenium naphthae]
MNKVKVSRRFIREKALQALFQISSHGDLSIEEAIEYALNSEETEVEDIDIPDYLNQLVQGVLDRQVDLDAIISKHLEHWSITRLPRTDLQLIRLATYELLMSEDVPDNVAMNEAIELAKLYSDEKSSKFINGVLSSIAESEKKEY